jgi:cystathionine beta-lyase/cystathionine gamma-synthase
MDAHLHNAQKVADFLAAHPAVKKVITQDWPTIRATMPRRLRQRLWRHGEH